MTSISSAAAWCKANDKASDKANDKADDLVNTMSRRVRAAAPSLQGKFNLMLFHVEMDVRIPHDLSAEKVDALKQAERTRAMELQRTGAWRHLWRVAGRYANVSVFDVSGAQELHDILSGLPLFPFMEIRVTPLCRHPSSIHDDDR